MLWYFFYPLEVQLGFCGLKKKKAVVEAAAEAVVVVVLQAKGRRMRLTFTFTLTSRFSSSFYCLMVFCIVKNDVFSWPPVRGGGQNGLKTRNTIYLCCIKAIRFYDISFSEFSTKWLLSWKRNNFGKIELVRMVQIALKWQFCSKCTYISALLYLVIVATSIFCRNLWAESCDASRASSTSSSPMVSSSSSVVDDYVLSWQAYILVENKKLGYFLNTQHQDYDE